MHLHGYEFLINHRNQNFSSLIIEFECNAIRSSPRIYCLPFGEISVLLPTSYMHHANVRASLFPKIIVSNYAKIESDKNYSMEYRSTS